MPGRATRSSPSSTYDARLRHDEPVASGRLAHSRPGEPQWLAGPFRAAPRVHARCVAAQLSPPATVPLMSTGPEPGAVPTAGVLDRLRGNRARLLLTSGTLLFVELLLIRWVPAEVSYIGFFSQLPADGELPRHRRRHPARAPAALNTVALFPLLLVAIVWMITDARAERPGRRIDRRDLLRPRREQRAPTSTSSSCRSCSSLVDRAHGVARDPARTAAPVDAAAAGLRAGTSPARCSGSPASRSCPPLGTNPVVWFARRRGAGGAADRRRGRPDAAAHPGRGARSRSSWSSPSRTLQPRRARGRRTTGSTRTPPATASMYVNVNGIPHQALPPGSPRRRSRSTTSSTSGSRIGSIPNVLIVGAGSGTDVAIALAHGAGPRRRGRDRPGRSRQLGIDFHPDHPYQDPRVTRYDERRPGVPAQRRDKKYDLIIFALPDSLTLVSSTANIRLESFLFTEQAFESRPRPPVARRRVRRSTTTTASNGSISKIDPMLARRVRQSPPICASSGRPRRRSSPPGRRSTRSTAGRRPATSVDTVPTVGDPRRSRRPTTGRSCTCGPRSSRTTTSPRSAFALVIALVGVLGARAARRHAAAPVQPALLRARRRRSCCSRRASPRVFSLLFGSTWLVNALAFFAILASVLAGDPRERPPADPQRRRAVCAAVRGAGRRRSCCRRSRC